MIFRTILVAISYFILQSVAYSQISAITESGDEVVLHENGTWEYLKDKVNKDTVARNPTIFIVPDDASFLMKSKKTHFGFKFNPKLWTIQKSVQHADAEYQIRLKDEDIYGMIITERVQIPIESLADIAIGNAKNVATNVKILKKEYRNVNGKELVDMTFQAKAQGIHFQYRGYYYSDESGSMQYLIFSTPAIMESESERIENLLNGFLVVEKE